MKTFVVVFALLVMIVAVWVYALNFDEPAAAAERQSAQSTDWMLIVVLMIAVAVSSRPSCNHSTFNVESELRGVQRRLENVTTILAQIRDDLRKPEAGRGKR